MNRRTLENSPELVAHEPLFRVRADHQQRDSDPEAEVVDLRRGHVVVEAPVVVPGDEDRGRVPLGALHDRVHDLGGPVLPVTHAVLGMLRQFEPRGHPCDGRQQPCARLLGEGVDREDVRLPVRLVLADVADRVVGGPEVAVLILGRRVVRPGDLRLAQQVALGEEVEAGRHLLLDTLAVDDHRVPVLHRVAAPRLEQAGVPVTFAELVDVLVHVLVRAARLRGDRVEMVGERRALRAREEVVPQDVRRGPVPVVRQILGLELRVRVFVRRLADRGEPVHLALVPGLERAVVAVADVHVEAVDRRRERPRFALIRPDRHAVRAREQPEHVVERPVLLDYEDDVLDRRRRLERVRVHGRRGLSVLERRQRGPFGRVVAARARQQRGQEDDGRQPQEGLGHRSMTLSQLCARDR